MQQAIDFYDESEALHHLLNPISEEDYEQRTQFKDWTINEVLGHLHIGNWAANLTLKNSTAFEKFAESMMEEFTKGATLREFEGKWLKSLKGKNLLNEWHQFYYEMSERFKTADPKKRLKWFGPDMSVRSKITARLMETWAHGQEVYDLLGVLREDKDRIRNIAQLGVNTFGWTFMNRSMDVPKNKPYVKLTAPSGEIWEWNDISEKNRVEGKAIDFCQVVTQVRNIEDTSIKTVGETAMKWMSLAQCFAGSPENPPEPGSRFTCRSSKYHRGEKRALPKATGVA